MKTRCNRLRGHIWHSIYCVYWTAYTGKRTWLGRMTSPTSRSTFRAPKRPALTISLCARFSVPYSVCSSLDSLTHCLPMQAKGLPANILMQSRVNVYHDPLCVVPCPDQTPSFIRFPYLSRPQCLCTNGHKCFCKSKTPRSRHTTSGIPTIRSYPCRRTGMQPLSLAHAL